MTDTLLKAEILYCKYYCEKFDKDTYIDIILK